jgi:gas vesicle protein
MRKLFAFLMGFLLGALVGAAIAVLLAPGSSDEMRQGLQARKEQVLEEGKRAYHERKAELNAHLEALKQGQTPES